MMSSGKCRIKANDNKSGGEFMKTRKVILFMLSLFLMSGVAETALAMGKSTPVPRMSKEELKSMLGDPNVIILDVRTGEGWKESKEKIQGAVREDPEEVYSWVNKYPKDKTLVLYCS